MRIRPRYMPMHKRWTLPRPAMRHRLRHGGVAFHRGGPVHLCEKEVREVRYQPRDIAAWRIRLNWRGDGIAVVFYHEQNGELLQRRRAQRLPELPLTGGTLADGCVDHFIAMEAWLMKGTVVVPAAGIGDLLHRIRMPGEIAAGFGAADCLQHLGCHRRALRPNIQPLAAPVGRHLPP